MESVTGVFDTRTAAEHAYEQLKQAGIPADKVTVLTPGSQDHGSCEQGDSGCPHGCDRATWQG